MHGVVSARKLQSVIAVACESGLDRQELLAAIDLAERDVAAGDRWLPQSVWHRLWLEVVARTGDPAIGLVSAQRIERGYFGVIDYVVRSCATMGEGIRCAARLFRLANTQGRLELVQRDGLLAIERHLLGDEACTLPRQVAEFALASMVRTFRLATAEEWALVAVQFRYPEPAYAALHRQFFGCPVTFGAPTDALVVDPRILSLPMSEPDETLRQLVEAHADTLLAELPAHQNVADDVRRALSSELKRGVPQAERVAARLGISRRSLHRELQALGTTFRGQLEALRRDLACRYLAHSEMSIGEITFLLGYSEVSTFHRAFRGWTGTTPAAYRSVSQIANLPARMADDAAESPR